MGLLWILASAADGSATATATATATESAPAMSSSAPATSTAPVFQSAIHDAVTTASQSPAAATSWWDVSKWDGTTWMTVSLATLVTLLIVAWGAVRFWLMVTRPAALKDVHTPTLDKMNTSALEHMGDDGPPVEDEEPPADLLAAVPEEEIEKAAEEKKDGESKAT